MQNPRLCVPFLVNVPPCWPLYLALLAWAFLPLAGHDQIAPNIQINSLNLAQSHVVDAAGRQWVEPDGDVVELHMVGLRPALALLDLSPAGLNNLQLEGRVGAENLGSVAIQTAAAALPPSEDNGPAFADATHVADVPGAWMRPGLELRVNGGALAVSDWQTVNVGARPDFIIESLPFYFFGADENLISAEDATTVPGQALDELYAKWAVTDVDVVPHPAGRVIWPELVVSPRNGDTAYVMQSYADRRDGFAGLATLHGLALRVRNANGDGGIATQTYAPMILENPDTGNIMSPGGGIGGSHVGTGDIDYRGIFIHEQGHAFGLPHAGESFNAGSGYPYPGGSLNGSNWGYDQLRRLFHPVIVPSSSSRFDGCENNSFAGTPRQLDDQGRCIRQDPMQSGGADKPAADRYSIFAYYHAGRMLRYFEGVTEDNGDGTRSYQGGRIIVDADSPTGYSRWDAIDRAYIDFDPGDDPELSFRGVNRGYPVERDVPVYTVVFTRSNTNTPGATRFYPVIGPWQGNLLRLFDPTVAADRQGLMPNVAPHHWFCRRRGCDFTIRVTYTGGLVRHYAGRWGFRPFFSNPDTPPTQNSTIATHPASQGTFALNIPADQHFIRIELLDTPQVWEGMPAQDTVLATITAPDSDGDGIPDAYESGNGLDPNDDTGDNGADGDLDGDGLLNIDEFNAGTAANNPDSDDDGLGDAIDANPGTTSNACVQDGNGDAEFDFTAMSGMTTQCAADNSIIVLDAANAVIESGAVLQLYSINISFQQGAAVPQGAELQTFTGDPAPGMAP